MAVHKKTLSTKQVEHIATLANLKLTTREIKLFKKQLSQVLDYFKLLNKLDTEKVKPTSQVTGLENVYRKDQVETHLPVKEVLKNTKKKHKYFFKVSSVFE